MATEHAAPGTITLDRSDGSATMDLYRATLGPVHTDGYLRAFTRFDAAGKSGPSWNWTAALLTLNWMLFRQLWAAALAYVGVLAGAVLLLFGIGRLLFQLPETGQWSLLALAVLLAIAVPGVYGNAWLYAACNKAITRALAASASLEEAATLLRKRASGRARLAGLAVANVALAGLLVAGWMGFANSDALPFGSGKMEQARAAGPAVSGLATQSMAGAETVASAAAAPSRTSQGLVQPASALLATLVPPAPATSTPAAAKAAASAPAAVASSLAAVASAPTPAAEVPVKPTKEELHAQALLAKKEKLAKEAQAAKEAKAAKAAEAKAAAQAAKTKAAAASDSSAVASDKYLINVGLFADANNARNAYTKLQDAGLPASIKELKSSKGPQIRVRAGPFDSEAEAENAAEKIRALKLEAVVIKP